MTLEQRKQAFVKLGYEIQSVLDDSISVDILNVRQKQFRELIERIHLSNGWFSADNVRFALQGIADMLRDSSLEGWLNNYPKIQEGNEPLKTVGVVMAGNIPAVGFHDFMSILISGNRIKAKLSSSDILLIPALAAMLCAIEPAFIDRIIFTEERLLEIDAIIATGSNNTSRYFEYYFSKYPHIIRKNRTSVAIITGEETKEELIALFDDVFRYFGQGCRNVTKIYVPQDYDLIRILEIESSWFGIINNKKYVNNYEYNKAIYLVNSIAHYDNGVLLVKEDESLHAPIGVLFAERYSDLNTLMASLEEKKESLQCMIASPKAMIPNTLAFGSSQKPAVDDYADGVDTLAFLSDL